MSQQSFVIQPEASVMSIYAEDEFKQLTETEKQYSYNFYRASWEGTKCNYFQKSYESPALFMIFQLIFSADNQTMQQYKEQALKQITEDEYKAIMVYIASVFNNCGNFKSFGDTKFVPNVSKETFRKFIQISENYKPNQKLIDELWNDIEPFVFAYEGKFAKIGFPGVGQSGYYSQNMTQDEINLVDDFLQILNKDPLNTRLVKIKDQHFQVLTASITPSKNVHYYKGNRIDLVNGDFSVFLTRVTKHLEEAVDFAANSVQKQMLKKYIEYFTTGNVDTFKDSQRLWVKDQGPILETNIGFIESYLDPKQVRAEWEGFISVVNKEQSKITTKFVEVGAPEFLKLMPWPKEFEKDVFLKPDFTCLQVLAFGSSGAPLGINIPNFDDIRQNEGFKNVYLANCLPQMKAKNIQYFNKKDCEILERYSQPMNFFKVIYHELLGHGCGKLLQKTGDTLNFDKDLIDPITGKPVASYYQEKETWMSVFQNLSNPYEECRADSVALYFSCIPEALEALIPSEIENFKDMCYAQYLSYIYGAIIGLEFFDVKQNKWGQAHINGRWVITQVLLEAGNNFLEIKKVKGEDGKDTIEINLDYDQILTTGKKAMGDFLLKLQVYKATANLAEGTKMFQGYSQVSQEFLEIRDIVIANKKPRRLEIQGNLFKNDKGEFECKLYEETHEGVIQSVIDRYPEFDSEFLQLFKEYQCLNKPSL